MVKKYPYVKVLRAVSDGRTDFYVDDEPVPAGRKIIITHWAAINKNHGFTKLTFLRKGHGYDHEFTAWGSPAADTLYWTNWEYHFTEGEVISTRFTGTTSGDELIVYLDGYWIKTEAEKA